ncbi:MAG: hypothetical protein SWK90_16325 [Chloroflexota bacterium]|nr:hypothetical protein [Chloroflexota bacterium]
MARFLVDNRRKWLWLAAMLAVIVVLGTILNHATAYAGSYYGKFTGYAMGNQYGGAGVEIQQGHFANHYYNWCPDDPAAWWGWGTRIDTPSIEQHNQAGQEVWYSTFYLYDVGDPTCSQGNYWVDVYFGRWEPRPPGDPNYCCCSGVPSPGYCYAGAVNSCTDAINFGYHYYWYTGP